MPSIIRTTAVWTGAPGLPGYSQFYQEVAGDVGALAQDGHNVVRAMFAGMVALLPEEVTITVDPLYQVLDAATGALTSEGTVTTPGVIVEGTYVGGWNAQVGVLIEWVTATIIASRHLRGRTYLVPLGDISDADGTLPTATIATIGQFANVLPASEKGFVVWHRPVSGAGGQVSAITGSRVRDHACTLRSRMR